MRNKTAKIVSLILVALFCFPMLSGSAEQLIVEREVFDTYGIEPILPLSGTLDISSIDYYHEYENDSLPGLHGGVDIIAPHGSSVMAVYSGVVEFAGYASDFGNYVLLRHTTADGVSFYSRYAHLSSVRVATSDTVSQGDIVGYVGMTGYAYVDHLHLEIFTTKNAGQYERSYTLKYLLSLSPAELSRMTFYYQTVEGEYNSQYRATVLGSGGSCYGRCGLNYEHNHISRYAEYIRALYYRSGIRMRYDAGAEAQLFSDASVRGRVYEQCDIDRDGHLSYFEVMSVTTLDLRGLGVVSVEGIEIFGNLSCVITDSNSEGGDDGTSGDGSDEQPPVYSLSVNYRIPVEHTVSAGTAGLWWHTDTTSKLWLRSGPSTSYSKVGHLPPDVTFIVSETAEGGGYTWGKTIYGGVEGWCALDPSWSEQLTSGRGTYTVDKDGYLIYTASGERVSATLRSDMYCSSLLNIGALDFLSDDVISCAWSYDATCIASDFMSLRELVRGLECGDMSLTLDLHVRVGDAKGDCDGNGVIDESDLMLLLRYIAGYRDAIVYPDAFDVNGDAVVNNRDLVAIRNIIQ